MSSCLCRPISRGACVLVKPGKCLLGIRICRQTPEHGCANVYSVAHVGHPSAPYVTHDLL